MQDKQGPSRSLRARMVKMLWKALPTVVLAGLIVLIIALFAAIGAEKERLEEEQARAIASGRPPVNVVLLEIKPGPISDRISLPGVIEPWLDLELLAKIGGEIIEVPVKEGDRLKKGQTIAQVDPEDYRIAMESAESAAKLAKANLDRIRTLFDKGLAPKAELDVRESQVETTRAAYDQAALMLSRCTITAPTGGVLRSLNAKVGLFLNIGDPIARIQQLDKVKAVIGIPESDVSGVARLKEVPIIIQALNDRTVTGRKYFLASSPENIARLYRLELAVDNGDRAILPGMFVKADLVKQRIKEAISVPLYAVLTRNNERFVFIEENGVAVRRPVEMGITEEWRVQITRGLSSGDRVLVEGHRAVEEGQELNIVKILTDTGEFEK